MSLYKDFKSLPDEKKLEAKMSLMQAVYNVKCPPLVPQAQVPASTVTSLSSSAGAGRVVQPVSWTATVNFLANMTRFCLVM